MKWALPLLLLALPAWGQSFTALPSAKPGIPTTADYEVYGKTLQGCYNTAFDGKALVQSKLEDCVGRVKLQCNSSYSDAECGRTEASMWLMVNDFYNDVCPDKAACAKAYKDYAAAHTRKVKDWRDTSLFYADMIAYVHGKVFADYGPLVFSKPRAASPTAPVAPPAPVKGSL
jgi:hypothetical protein